MAAVRAATSNQKVTWQQQGSTTIVKFTPRGTQDFTRPPVVYLHGGSLTNSPGTGSTFPVTLLSTTLSGFVALDPQHVNICALTQAGYRVYVPFTGPNWCATTCTYPGATGTGAITDCLTLAVADGHPANQVLLRGDSMGGGNMFSWAVANASKVKSAYATVPLVDIVDAHSRSLLTVALSGSIEAQWTASYASTCLGVNPTSNTGSWTTALQQKFKCVWASDDSVVVSSTVSTFTTALPSITVLTLSGNDHFVHLDTGFDDYDCVRWFDAAIGRTH